MRKAASAFQKYFTSTVLQHIPALVFILIVFLIGMRTYRDYGISWDEKYNFEIARVNARYIQSGNPELLTFNDRYYGPFFELLYYPYLNQIQFPEYVYYRHRLNFAAFCGGLVFFYLLAYRMLKNSRWALAAVAMLALSPRIFADAFYNPKDIPLMITFIAAGWSGLWLLDELRCGQKIWRTGLALAIHAAACGAAVATRVVGLVLVPIQLAAWLGLFITLKERRKRLVVAALLDMGLTTGMMVLFWPILWHDPLGGLRAAFEEMSHYPWTGLNLYLGQLLPAQNLPWHYLPVWIGVTTPLLVLVGWWIGHITGAQELFMRVRKAGLWQTLRASLGQVEWIYALAWMYGPLAAVWLFRATLYDGWRQMFFIYSAIVLLAAGGLKNLWNWLSLATRPWGRILVGILLAVGLLEPMGYILRWHPFENVYFNLLAGNPAGLRDRFDQDYWGLSYKQAVDHILAEDDSAHITIAVQSSPGKSYVRFMLPAAQAARLTVVEEGDPADYFITTYRMHPDDYDLPDPVYSINVGGVEILTVFRLSSISQ